MKLLYVENHIVFAQQAIRQFLFDCDVTLVPSISAAYVHLKTTVFELILVDYDLDDGKGDSLVRALRHSGWKGKIIAVSAQDHKNLILLRSGADMACSKMTFSKIRPLLGIDSSGLSGLHTKSKIEIRLPCERIENSLAPITIELLGHSITSLSVAASNMNEDQLGVCCRPNSIVLAVADGAGGVSGGRRAAERVMESVRAASSRTSPPYLSSTWQTTLHQADTLLASDPESGESTATVVEVRDGHIEGASVGDSEAWLVSETSVKRLTFGQTRSNRSRGKRSMESTFPGTIHREKTYGSYI